LRTSKKNARLLIASGVTVVADSSLLVILTKLGRCDLLNHLFPRVYISAEVHYEVVIAGAGLPGSSEVSKTEWIEVKTVQNPAGLYSAQICWVQAR